MQRIQRNLAAVTLAFALLAGGGPAWGDEADDLYDQGTTALKAGNAQEAFDKLSKAFAIKRSVDIAANLALAEQKLGMNREAAEHLGYALANYPATADPAARDRMQALLDTLKKGLCEIRVRTEEGAAVRVGERNIGMAPLTAPLYVKPGEHMLSAEKGGDRGNVKIEVSAGESRTITIHLEIGPKVAPTASATVAPTGSAIAPVVTEPRPVWPAVVLGVVGAGGLAAGGALVGVSAGRASDAEGVNCPGGEETCPKDAIDAVDEANVMLGAGIAGFAVGGLAAIGLITYLVLPEEEVAAKSTARLRITPVLGPEQAGAVLKFSF